MRTMISSIVSLSVLLLTIHPVVADAARDTTKIVYAPEQRIHLLPCANSKYPYGPGQIPNSKAVTLALRQQVLDGTGRYQDNFTSRGYSTVRGNELQFRFSIHNASIFDVRNIEIAHQFMSQQLGLKAVVVSTVTNATYDAVQEVFRIERIDAGETAVVTFRLLLSETVQPSLSQHILTLQYFAIHKPPSFAVNRVGIGYRNVLCFQGDENNQGPYPYSSNKMKDATNDSDNTLRVYKDVSAKEVLPGSLVSYTVTVTNKGDSPLTNIKVDERFPMDKMSVEHGGSAIQTGFGLRWIIDELSPGEIWNASYQVRVADDTPTGSVIPDTTIISSDDVANLPSDNLTTTIEIRVFGKGFVVPETGVNMYLLFVFAITFILSICIASIGAILSQRRQPIILS